MGKWHGLGKSRLYNVWKTMRRRCNSPTANKYKNYGGRGIKVCNEWQEFPLFYEWAMANGYADNLTIDRIDNDGDYCPENCRWATNKEQARNRRSNHLITYQGETHTLIEWSEITGIPRHKLSDRLCKLNWTVERALEGWCRSET